MPPFCSAAALWEDSVGKGQMECYDIQRQGGCTGAWMQNSAQRLEIDWVGILASVAWSPLPLLSGSSQILPVFLRRWVICAQR